MNGHIRNLCLMLALCSLTACQSGEPGQGIELSSNVNPRELMVTIAKTMQRCWFKNAIPAFRKYRMASEVNSFAGRPRLLLVPKSNPTGLPSLVVQAEKQKRFTQVQAFGPLLSSSAGKAISTDLKNWTSGKTACAGKIS